ncbi:MAG: polymorphic toxin-type HINT domain-containing protein [Planctomycetota bacterium]
MKISKKYNPFLSVLLGLILFWSGGLPVWARGGGGCLLEGTNVNTPNGPVPIQNIKPGDYILGRAGNGITARKVLQAVRIISDEYIELNTGSGLIKATPEHPFFTGPDTLKLAGNLSTADTVLLLSRNRLVASKLLSVNRIKSICNAYNLIVEPPGTFLAEGVLVHNKGCFLPDTEITLDDGSKTPISRIKIGDKLKAFNPDGRIVIAPVLEIITAYCNNYYLITTDKTRIKVTAEHPLYIGDNNYRLAATVNTGDTIWLFDGTKLSPETIRAKELINSRCAVYNLRTDYPNTFFANGVAVHNKGGGCFLADTRISLDDGREAHIQDLSPGQAIRAFMPDGKLVTARVNRVISLTAPEYYQIATAQGEVMATPEHPFAVSADAFRSTAMLEMGQPVLYLSGHNLTREIVITKQLIQQQVVVYNLQVDYPHTFFANGIGVHNKGGGCFPTGTMITTPDGLKPIDSLKAGDMVSAVTKAGRITPAKVVRTYATTSALVRITTPSGILYTTDEHPLLGDDGKFQLVAGLTIGQSVMIMCDNSLKQSRITDITRLDEEVIVYNLEVDEPHTFIADGFVVHNKGGGGGGFRGGSRSSSRSSGSSDDAKAVVGFIVAGIILAFIIFSGIVKNSSGDGELDYCYPMSKVEKKSTRTYKLLLFLSKQNPSMAPEQLKETAADTFTKLQSCWQAREYSPMAPLMMPYLYNQHLVQISSMKRTHEINIIAGLKVDIVEIVRVRYYEKADKREFTALIQAKARDYYVDDRDNKFLRGDDSAATFQEFWTFQLQGNNWLLRDVEQTKESDALTDKNFVEMFTDAQIAQIYGDSVAGDTGPTGPEAIAGVVNRDDKIHRHLNFLVQLDKIWNIDFMKETARTVFIAVYAAKETNDLSLSNDLVYGKARDVLQTGIQLRRNRNETIEYRNICVRRVDIVLVRNYADNTKDEFTARISAHAQKAIKKDGTVISQDEYVRPFLEYWTFGRRDNKWLLKEILPSAHKLDGQSDIDEDASPEQIEWYQSKDRAL